MKLKRVCVLGGTGFVGQPLVARLGATGRQVIVPTRRRERHRDLLVLPSVKLVEADIHDPAVLHELFAGQDAVINLVGILNERGHGGFRQVHVELARKVIQACQDVGVHRLLHMSALNADQAQGTSWYLRSKGEAENLLHTFRGRVAVTSLRPSVIFGPRDGFTRRFERLLRLTPGIFPLACPHARFAPVYVGDVVDAFVRTLEDRSSFGRRYDLCGPRSYELIEIVRYIARVSGHRRWVVGLPDWASRWQARLLGLLPGRPFTLDNYDSMRTDSVCRESAACPSSMEGIVPRYLGQGGPTPFDRFRQSGRGDRGAD
jgi:NADH dehydrogenase